MTFGQRFARVVTDIVVRRPALVAALPPAAALAVRQARAGRGTTMRGPTRSRRSRRRSTGSSRRRGASSTSARAPARSRASSRARFRRRRSSAPTSSAQMIDEARRLTRLAARHATRSPTRRSFRSRTASFDLVTLGNMIPFFDELARVRRTGRARAHRLLGRRRRRRSTCRPSACAPSWSRRGFRGICGAFGRARDVSLLAVEELTCEHTERSRSGCTVLDVPSRGGEIRPALCSAREAPAPARPAPRAVLHAAARAACRRRPRAAASRSSTSAAATPTCRRRRT